MREPSVIQRLRESLRMRIDGAENGILVLTIHARGAIRQGLRLECEAA